ncbi:hypothetical protein CspeluHIS016_0202830 [Cutaneotrichosporon spelunceum]|uniref:Type 1 phosphatases regulator n=1 Tax=Cutaneotrichosporon spelunceum TaxID=1672016 RepID=A0AAD3TRM1_9TREE|nr:hypothetical protein CspeluHIS016_0202830 [Cutaneotrichosporon spelunceum]
MTINPTTDTDAEPSTASPPASRSETPSSVGVLRLRGGPGRRQRVVWTSDTVDNEGMGKKKSKICCIYHKPRAFDESSSESDSCGPARKPRRKHRKHHGSKANKYDSQPKAPTQG